MQRIAPRTQSVQRVTVLIAGALRVIVTSNTKGAETMPLTLEVDRRQEITGTTISSVMGCNPYKSTRRLYEEMVGNVLPEDISKKWQIRVGIKAEDIVAEFFTEETGSAVRRAPGRYVHKEYPSFSCQVDRLVTGTDQLLECKVVSARASKDWEGADIPIYYELQVQWQLFVTGRKIGWIAVLIGNEDFKYKMIEADPGLHQKMADAALAFLDMVRYKIPPAPEAKDNALMVNLYPEAGKEIKEAAQDMTAAVAFLQQTKAQIIDLEKVKDETEAKIKESIKDLLGIRTPEYTVKWINVKGSTFTVTKPDTRQLRITKNKE